MAVISIFEDEALKDYFDRAVRRPGWRPWLAAFDDAVEVKVEIGPVRISRLTEVFRDFTETSRYGFAAWRWLRPNQPRLSAADLGGLQALAGLDHVPPQTFAAKLVQRCRETARDHPQLARWVQYRAAALEYVARPPGQAPPELADTSVDLRHSLLRVNHLYHQVPRAAQQLAHWIAVTAMEGAARATVQAFNCDEGSVSANLMVPVSEGVRFASAGIAAENGKRADELWAGVTSGQRLLIVAETRGSHHIGFWVPITRGDRGGVWLPGAPTAYCHGEGDAVFVDDLPPLAGVGDAIEARWRAYMMEHFKERLFVSLPFRAPDGRGGYVTPGVLNVNVDCRDIDAWFRAYHPEWLHVARDRVRPFVEIALGALLVMLAGRDDAPRLDTGSDRWDTLPSVVPRLPKGGSQ